MRTSLRWCDYSRGLGRSGSSIGLWMRASKVRKSTEPTKLQLGTLGKNLAAAIMIVTRTAKTMLMTISTMTSSKESRTGRQLPESDC